MQNDTSKPIIRVEAVLHQTIRLEDTWSIGHHSTTMHKNVATAAFPFSSADLQSGGKREGVQAYMQLPHTLPPSSRTKLINIQVSCSFLKPSSKHCPLSRQYLHKIQQFFLNYVTPYTHVCAVLGGIARQDGSPCKQL